MHGESVMKRFQLCEYETSRIGKGNCTGVPGIQDYARCGGTL